MAVVLEDDEFDLIYRTLRASVTQDTLEETATVMELEDEAWAKVQAVAQREGYITPS